VEVRVIETAADVAQMPSEVGQLIMGQYDGGKREELYISIASHWPGKCLATR